MITKNYLIVEENIVTNGVVWDGNTQTWMPPENSIQLIQETTPALIWQPVINTTPITWSLQEVIGVGDIGFTWDGKVLTTNQPVPTPPVAAQDQPTTTGTITI